jgi:hypothetical protein
VTEAAIATIEGFQAGYVTIAGLPTWHEVGGEGPAVVLLRGGSPHGLPLELPGLVNTLLISFLSGAVPAPALM